MFSKIKELINKEEKFESIVWDGKTVKYLNLTQKEIDEINNSDKYKGWSAYKKSEC